jgi:hypothetical protein
MPTFYATVDADSIRPSMPDVAYLLTATSFWRRARRLSPVTLPPHVRHIAVDPGGFVAATRYGGSYPFTRGQCRSGRPPAAAHDPRGRGDLGPPPRGAVGLGADGAGLDDP